MDAFRLRVQAAAARVAERTGVDPLDLRRSMAVTTDARLELLPQSVGIGAGLMAVAIGGMCIRFLAVPAAGPGVPATTAFVVVGILLALGAATCVLVARAARSRRPVNESYEDAWARLAVELWPSPHNRAAGDRLSYDRAPHTRPPGSPVPGERFAQTSAPATGSGARYSRTEFLIAIGSGADIGRFEGHAPFTRMP